MSNYPPGSMRGSGIYQTEMMIDVLCDASLPEIINDGFVECGWSGEVEGTVNDYGNSGVWSCPLCFTLHDFDVSDYKDEYYYEEED